MTLRRPNFRCWLLVLLHMTAMVFHHAHECVDEGHKAAHVSAVSGGASCVDHDVRTCAAHDDSETHRWAGPRVRSDEPAFAFVPCLFVHAPAARSVAAPGHAPRPRADRGAPAEVGGFLPLLI